MQLTDLSLKWLEVFRLTAKLGTVQAVARETGLSISTVSHHLRSLEDHLGIPLVDHARRPMKLTHAGDVFLKHVDEAISLLNKGCAELTLGNLADARYLRLGLIEDFDSDIGPELAVYLATAMPKCGFAHFTRFSREIFDLLQSQKLDIGIASRTNENSSNRQECPILRDPFVLAIPASSDADARDYLSGSIDLPMLRYASDQQISSQIDAQLRRLKINLPKRFEVESNQTMMAMIASGTGWAVTTPTCYFRAGRFHDAVRLHPFPTKGFARYLSLFATAECADQVIQTINAQMRTLLEAKLIQPALRAMPWLKDRFHLLPADLDL